MDRLIFHVDVNNAFLSWESMYRTTVLNPPLRLLGIRAAKISEENYNQLSLFSMEDEEQKKKESIKDTLFLTGLQGFEP